MKRTVISSAISILTLVLFLPVATHAQHWTAEEQEIIELNQNCWDAWASEDWDSVQQICNDHPDGRGWWTADGAPGIGWLDKNAVHWGLAFHPRDKWLYWEIRPLSVRIFNDTALIHFWATLTTEDLKGNTTTKVRKQLNIWQRIDGRWTWIGGMAAPEGE